MADEVIITYWTKSRGIVAGQTQPIYGKQLGGQVLDIGTKSAEIPDFVNGIAVEIIKVKAKGSGFWILRGDTNVSAAADTDGNDWMDTGDIVDLEPDPVNTFIDTAADA